MKKLIYSLLFMTVSAYSFAGNTEFSYDKDALATEFNQLNDVSAYVDENNVSFTELSKNPAFEGNLNLTNHISVAPNSAISDMDWVAFAWGFLCCPVGALLYLMPNRDKSDEEKQSFYYGFSTMFVIVLIAGIPLGRTTVTF